MTWERDSSDQNSLLPSYGQDVEQEVIKQRPGRPVADSDGDFAIPSQNRLHGSVNGETEASSTEYE